MELHGGAGEENQIAQNLHAHGDGEPGDREVCKGYQEGAYEKPYQKCVDDGEPQSV